MTWAKFGVEYRSQLAKARLSDAAARTHTDALMWLYETEAMDMRIPKDVLRTVTATADYDRAAKELAAAGYWKDRDDEWEVVHHAGVVRDSIRQQHVVRARNRRAQAAWRARQAAPESAGGVSAYADSQTDSQSPRTEPHTGDHSRGRPRTRAREDSP
jgi:hypothetical protein